MRKKNSHSLEIFRKIVLSGFVTLSLLVSVNYVLAEGGGTEGGEGDTDVDIDAGFNDPAAMDTVECNNGNIGGAEGCATADCGTCVPINTSGGVFYDCPNCIDQCTNIPDTQCAVPANMTRNATTGQCTTSVCVDQCSNMSGSQCSVPDGFFRDSLSGTCIQAAGSCTLSASPTSIANGSSATLSYRAWKWSGVLEPTNLMITPDVGALPGREGTVSVSPSATKTYTFTGEYRNFGVLVGTLRCSTNVYVGSCTDRCSNLSGNQCDVPAGYSRNTTTNTCTICTDQCSNADMPGTQCTVPTGYTRNATTGMCTLAPACNNVGLSCVGNQLWRTIDYANACHTFFQESCPCGCTTSGCTACGGTPTSTIAAVPPLVHRNETTSIVWSSSSMTSCNVTASNDSSWQSTQLTGSKESPAIIGKTTFTLSCVGNNGTTYLYTTEADIVPAFREI